MSRFDSPLAERADYLMDPHEPFLKAILASRHDDLPRLVYADWLEESGEPANMARAHFIRTQIHLEHTDPKSEVFGEMKALEARVLDDYLDEWRWVDLPDFVRYGSDLEQVKWRRGFPDDLGPMTVKQFIELGATAVREVPLTSVQLTDHRDGIDLSLFPCLKEVTRLKLGPRFSDLDSPFQIDLLPVVPDSVTFNSLMGASVFNTLQHLDLSENALDDSWVVAFSTRFAAASFAPTLESLDLSGNFGITDAGANVLATAAGLDGLAKLRIRDTRITPTGRNLLKKRFGNRLS